MPDPITSVRLESDGPGAGVTKTATSAHGVARLRAEAAILRAARHPGVVDLLDAGPRSDPMGQVDGFVVRTRIAGSRTFANLGRVQPERTAGLVAALAATVADLHRLGIAHGRITADHVILSADGRPILCGFGEARHVEGGTRPDPRSADVAALGDLLRELLGDATDPDEPEPRLWHRRRPEPLRGALLNLADHASADDPAHRPSAARFAASLRDTAPEATLDDMAADGGGTPRRARLGIVGAAAAGVVALLGLGITSRSGPAEVAASSPTAPSPTTRLSISTTTSSPTVDTSAAATSAVPDGADGCATDTADGSTWDGRPCPVSLRFEAGELTIASQRFAVDAEAAAAAVGDFTCDGAPRAAVLDLATGIVHVFEEWASDDAPATSSPVAQVPAPRQLVAEPLPGGCHRLIVLDQWGLRHPVDLPMETSP